MIRLSTLLITICHLLISSCTPEKPHFYNCFSPETISLLNDAEITLDSQVAQKYGRNESIDSAYKSFLKQIIQDDRNISIDYNNNSAIEYRILNNRSLKEIWNWSLELGDTTYFYPVGGKEELIRNEIRFNVNGSYSQCLREMNDSIDIGFLSYHEDMGNIPFVVLASTCLEMLDSRGIDDPTLKQLILINFYLRPLVGVNWVKPDK